MLIAIKNLLLHIKLNKIQVSEGIPSNIYIKLEFPYIRKVEMR